MKIELPNNKEIERIADWIELYVLLKNSDLSKSQLTSILEEDNSDDIDESLVDSILTTLEYRQRLYGSSCPFIVNNSIIRQQNEADWHKIPEHIICLYYSTYGGNYIPNIEDGRKLFERITFCCLKLFLNAEGVVIGFPAEKNLKEQLDYIAEKINAKRNDDPRSTDKDRGVDIILYKKLDDLRSNHILLFVQCAAGKNWNTKKACSIESYRRYFTFHANTAMCAISTTQIVNKKNWDNVCDDYGLVIDRARLFRMLHHQTDSNEITSLKAQVTNWVEQVLQLT